MATLAIIGNKQKSAHILNLFRSMGAITSGSCSLEDGRLYYIGHEGQVLSIADQPDNIYRNLLFNVYTIEEFERQFPFRQGDKVAFDVYASPEEPVKEKTSVIKRLSWNTECCDVCYIMTDGCRRSAPSLRDPKPEFKPKDGDVVSSGGYMFICKSHLGDDKILAYAGYNFYSDKIIESLDRTFYANHISTEEEKQKLFDKLKENGLAWDAEKRELVKLKWKPTVDEKYYYPFFKGCLRLFEVHSHTNLSEHELSEDKEVIAGWCFKTKDECQEFCDKLNQAIKDVKP